MNNRSLVAASLITAGAVSMSASAALIAGWSIPTAVAAPTIGNGYSYGAADLGEATAGTSLSGFHAVAATTWSSPAGNGSTYSLSSNNWSIGDYYQISLSTTGYADPITISFDHTRSGTGPATWTVIMSVDGGTNWSTLLATFAPIINSASPTGAGTWSTTVYNAAYTSSIALGAAADNAASILVRVQATVDPVNSTGVYQAGGTARIDNVFINGTGHTP